MAADATVETLQIQIEASSSDAAKKVNELAQALRDLKKASKGGAGLSNVTTELDKIKSASIGASKSFRGLKAIIGAIGMRRIVSFFGDAVSSINEYVETLNLFKVSMGSFYDEAYEYAELVNEKLGVDPAQWMKAQGVFMSMGKGFGMSEKQAYGLSKSLTELSYDIASLYNEDIQQATNRLQSALAGEIEPIRRLGISISQATLEEYALSKGINESVASMTEQEKALLRSLKLIESSKNIGAVGDFAKTLESPANAIRVLNQQITQFGRAIGSVLLPVIVQVLPYIQAFTSLLTDLISKFAVFVGFTMPEWDNKDWSSGFDGAADSVDDTTKAVKKLKNATIGLDELNIISQDNGAAAGAGGVSDWAKDLEIPSLWNKEQIKAIETQASKLKEKLEPILDLALKIGAALLAMKIADSVFTAVSNLKEKLGGLKNAADGISKGRLLTIGITLAVTGAILEWDAIKEIILEGMDWGNLAELVIGEGTLISGGATIGKAFGNSIMGAAIGAIVASVPALITSVYDAINKGLNTKNGLSIITNAAVLGAGIGALIAGPIGAGVGAAIGAAVGAVTDLAIYIGQNWDQIKEEAKSDWDAMVYQWNDTIRVFSEAWELGKQKIGEAFGPFWAQLKEEAKAEWDRTVTYWKDFWGDITTFVTETIPNWFENDVKPWFTLEKWKELGKNALDGLFNGLAGFGESVKNWGSDFIEKIKNRLGIHSPSKEFEEIGKYSVAGMEKGFSGLNGVSDMFNESLGVMKSYAVGFSDEIRIMIDNGLSAFLEFLEEAKRNTQSATDSMTTMFRTMASNSNAAIASIISSLNSIPRNITTVHTVVTKSVSESAQSSVKAFAAGGFPDHGQMFIARESGPELVGQIGSRTAVANNNQIVAAIEEAAYRGFLRANSESDRNGMPVIVENKVYLDGKQMRASFNKAEREAGASISTGGVLTR